MERLPGDYNSQCLHVTMYDGIEIFFQLASYPKKCYNLSIYRHKHYNKLWMAESVRIF